jgi:hypothetical protein
MDGWNAALLAVSAYVAVTVLVRFMLARRNALLVDLRKTAEAQQKRKKRDSKRSKREAA